MRHVLAIIATTLSLAWASGEEPTPEQVKRIEELRKQVGEKRAELAKLEAELQKLMPLEFKHVEDLSPATIELGHIGPLKNGQLTGTIVAEQIIDDNYFLAKVIYGRGVEHRYVIKMKTTGWADGKVLEKWSGKEWLASGTVKKGGTTYYVLQEPPAK